MKVKLKNPQLIYGEIKRIELAIDTLTKQLKTIEESEVRELCELSLHELHIRKSTLEWIFE